MTINQAGRRLLSAAAFDPDAYDTVRDDPAATAYAIGIVVVASIAAGLGGLLWAMIAATPPQIFRVDLRYLTLHSLVIGSIAQVGLWLVWVAITHRALQSLMLVRDASFTGLIRTMGFAFAPMALQIFIFFPVLEFPIGIIAIAAMFGCSVLAVRSASGATPGQALLATLFGFIVFAFALGFLGTSDSDNAPGIWALDPNSLSIRLKYDTSPAR